MSSDKQRPQVPSDMKAFNAKLIEEFRAKRGELSGQMAGRQLMLLTTKGRRSGQERTVVIGYRPFHGEYAVIASNNGAPKPPSWFLNLEKNPTAMAEVGPDKFEVRARVASSDERDEAAKVIDYLEPQQAKAQREIPVLVLEKV
jgi:deazaflavin-dependent oxidoreductase (nitroreductase family)